MIGKFLACTIMVTVHTPQETVDISIRARGKVLKVEPTKYVMDFSEDLKHLPLLGGPKVYSKMAVLKEDCE